MFIEPPNPQFLFSFKNISLHVNTMKQIFFSDIPPHRVLSVPYTDSKEVGAKCLASRCVCYRSLQEHHDSGKGVVLPLEEWGLQEK